MHGISVLLRIKKGLNDPKANEMFFKRSGECGFVFGGGQRQEEKYRLYLKRVSVKSLK